MADFNTPSLSSLYTTFLSQLKARDVDAITMCLSDPTNTPTGAMKWNRSTNIFQEWNGAAWVDKVLGLTGGGTGATSAAGIRSALSLGSMALQNSNAVTITGGVIGSATAIDAASIVSGTIAQARLGSGATGAGAKVLYDNQTWYYAVLVGSIVMWPGSSAPAGWAICNGQAISRATYADLFAIIGTAYGVGDGSTTYNLPNMGGRFPFGAGTNPTWGYGVAVSQVADVFSHDHTSAAHAHGISGVYPHSHTGSVNISDPGHGHNYRALSGGGGLVYFVDGGFTDDNSQDNSHAINVNTTGITATTTIDSAGGTTSTDSATPGNTGGAQHFPPYVGLNFIIKIA